MMIAISEIKKNTEGIAFNESLNIKEKLMQRSSEVLDVKAVSVNGIVSYDDGLYLLNYRLDYTITLPSSRSMQPVDVHQVEDVSEVFVESADLHTQEDLVKENLALVLELLSVSFKEKREEVIKQLEEIVVNSASGTEVIDVNNLGTQIGEDF